MDFLEQRTIRFTFKFTTSDVCDSSMDHQKPFSYDVQFYSYICSKQGTIFPHIHTFVSPFKQYHHPGTSP